MKKGEFALSNIVSMILILVATLAIFLFIYFLRDNIKELIEIVFEFLGF
tara:strand:+ start:419 stop:565 length:147 start_codon:yes stop_codon:yes gene_type:complete